MVAIAVDHQRGRAIDRGVDEDAVVIAGDEIVGNSSGDRIHHGRIAVAADVQATGDVGQQGIVGDGECALLNADAIAAVVMDVVVVDGGVAAESEDSRLIGAADVVAVDNHPGRADNVNTAVAAGNGVASNTCAQAGAVQQNSRGERCRGIAVLIATDDIVMDAAGCAETELNAALGDQTGQTGPAQRVSKDIHAQAGAVEGHPVVLIVGDGVIADGQAPRDTVGVVGINRHAALHAIERVVSNSGERDMVDDATGVVEGDAFESGIAIAVPQPVDRHHLDRRLGAARDEDDRMIVGAGGEAHRDGGRSLKNGPSTLAEKYDALVDS